MKRFSVMVTEYGADREVELCQLDGDPEPAKTLMVHASGKESRRRTRIPKYMNIRVIDRQPA